MQVGTEVKNEIRKSKSNERVQPADRKTGGEALI